MAAIKACHAKYPQANAVLIEDKANGPAIISELQKEIPGVVPVNPEGGKLARAQATAPLWESGSIELPDPQLFGCAWVEDYLHNICTFPKAAHDDDVDATSQALIYMRSRLGGGIVEFYRMQATGEVRESPAARKTARATSGSTDTMEESVLMRNVNEAVAQGSQIHCNVKQYSAIRAALTVAAKKSDVEQSLQARTELERLDQLFRWQQ
jgi:predicted phage terminase large subunit-like protein